MVAALEKATIVSGVGIAPVHTVANPISPDRVQLDFRNFVCPRDFKGSIEGRPFTVPASGKSTLDLPLPAKLTADRETDENLTYSMHGEGDVRFKAGPLIPRPVGQEGRSQSDAGHPRLVDTAPDRVDQSLQDPGRHVQGGLPPWAGTKPASSSRSPLRIRTSVTMSSARSATGGITTVCSSTLTPWPTPAARKRRAATTTTTATTSIPTAPGRVRSSTAATSPTSRRLWASTRPRTIRWPRTSRPVSPAPRTAIHTASSSPRSISCPPA